MRPADRLLLGALLIAAVGLGVKLTLAPRNVYPDRERLARTIGERLTTAGFSVTRGEDWGRYRLHARKGDCRLTVQQVDVEAAERSVFARQTATTGSPRFLYRGQASPDFPRFLPVLTDQAQRQAARLGLVFAIDPIIALAASPACDDPAPLLAGLSIHPQPGPPAIRAAPRE